MLFHIIFCSYVVLSEIEPVIQSLRLSVVAREIDEQMTGRDAKIYCPDTRVLTTTELV